MSFRRGASLTTASTLGFTEAADVGPTAGNGFRTRWPDDLALLQDIGITDVRITLDWARLQPKPSTIDADWAEQFEQILRAADAIGLQVLACLHDGSIPKWFDNEGGFDDDEAFVRWWPRWVERAAERFGAVVGGWVPFACIPSASPAQAWTDTWGILAGGPPVVAAVDLRDGAASISGYNGRADLLGAVLTVDWEPDTDLAPADITEAGDRWGSRLREAGDAVDHPLVVTGFSAGHGDAGTAGEIIDAARSVIDEAIGDGVAVDAVFVEPGIAGPDSLPGLVDQDRERTPLCEAFLTGLTGN